VRRLGLVLMAVAMVAVATAYAFAAGHENCPMMQAQGAEKKVEAGQQGTCGMKPGAGCQMMMGGGEAKSGARCPMMMGGGEAKAGARCPMMMGRAAPRPGPGCRMMAADRGPMHCEARMARGMRHEGRDKPCCQGRQGRRAHGAHGVVTL
jgi:hypothetical protein